MPDVLPPKAIRVLEPHVELPNLEVPDRFTKIPPLVEVKPSLPGGASLSVVIACIGVYLYRRFFRKTKKL